MAKACYFRYEPDPSYRGKPTNHQAYAAQSQPSSATNWILDSGATSHVTNDLNNLNAFFQYDGTNTLQIGNGAGLPIHHIGSTSFSLSSHSISITNILHVPQFSKNLISVSQLLLDNPNLTIEFSNCLCYLKDKTTQAILLHTPCHNGLFSISPIQHLPPQAFLGVRVSGDLWHARLCHPSTSTTLHLLNSAHLPCTSSKLSNCHDCYLAKSQKLPFTPSFSTSSSPLELIHSHVWGPSPTSSFNNYNYYVIFVDDYSKYTWVYFLKRKSEIPFIFSRFKAQVENLLSHKIKTLRTDGGSEYLPITKQFPHILHQTTCPHTPNGLSERKHRHIVTLAIATMTHASLPSIYWDEIFSSVVYLINRLPDHTLSVPYTTLFNKPPDYTFLKVLGCICFPYTRPYNSNKLEPRALPCLFLGYAITQKGYRCLHLPTNKLYISRHVRFDETFFPFQNPSPKPAHELAS